MSLPTHSFGVLLPVFSLPDSGSLDEAFTFVDFLTEAGASTWQVLPLGPTHEDGSPYLALSAHAANPELIGMEMLQQRLDRRGTLRELFDSVGADVMDHADFHSFATRTDHWLPQYALYQAIRSRYNRAPWFEWPDPLKHRDPGALAEMRTELQLEVDFHTWQQYEFFRQWGQLKAYCHGRNIQLYGDMPLYVAHDSSDVWQYPELFRLNPDGSSSTVAGVPPDYFSPTGQRWGNPIYAWEEHHSSGFSWWINRMRSQQVLFDIIRIDHFRGLESFWEIPGDSETAETGQWQPGPGAALLGALTDAIPNLVMVAEDLGTITHDVETLRNSFALPGIRVLQFGFDGVADNPHAPENLVDQSVLYTGTHDNDTSVGWYGQLHDWQRHIVDERLAGFAPLKFPHSLVACAFAGHSNLVIIPMQDLLCLDADGRINTPGTVVGNWSWQMDGAWPMASTTQLLQSLASQYHRQHD